MKSNIGHCESAAGIAGLTKILLQLRHGQLAPSLHADTLNPHIDFERTPFVVQRELAEWPRDGQPRRAGLSSFGAGGSNAHLILEEPPAAPPARRPAGPALVVLSAKDEQRLRETVQRLRDYLDTEPNVELHDLAYTLQLGREAMDERLAAHVQALAELQQRLTAYLADASGGWHRGRAERGGETAPPLGGHRGRAERGGETAPPLADPDALCRGWVEGEAVDWDALYEPAAKPRRVSLPTYPFARERYWLPVDRPSAGGAPAPAQQLHALVHRNTSTLWGQRFETTLTGAEFFLSDHRVQGRPVLPAMVSPELARAAVALALELPAEAIRLARVAWVRPFVAGDGAQPLEIGLSANETATVTSFEISSRPSPDGEPVVHVHGEAVLDETPDRRQPPRVDLAAARAACDPAPVSIDACYAELAERGLVYGPGMRGLAELHAGDGQVVARLAIPPAIDGTREAYVLHPALLDSALQAGMALHVGDGGEVALPFALDELAVFGSRPDEVWAWLRVRAGGQVFDVDLCDQRGRVWVRLTGLAARALEAVGALPAADASDGEPAAGQDASSGEPAAAQDASGGMAAAAQDASAGELSRRVARYLAVSLASVIKLPADRIGLDEPLDSYGVDSIAAVELIRRLEASFGPLARTLVFEHRTINALADYFVAAHADRLAAVLPAPSPVPGPVTVLAAPRPAARRRASRPAQRASGDIAIVGLAGRYPQAESLAEFWENLQAGRDCVTPIPAERWDAGAHGLSAGWGGFLSGVDRFDPLFFNISPADAELMDPQERLFLECAYATLQDAGYTRAQAAAAGQVGVFVGVMYEEYQLYSDSEQAVASSASSIANRVSYFCDFHGPSLALDTMCSSSLTAIHLACQSIQRGESQLALAGGVNVSVHPNKYLMLEQGGFLSASGRCESFGAGGDGYIPGEGVGAVLLKALDQAVADHDHIHAVIKASAVNHGGRTNGYTVPNPAAQADVITRALRDAQIAPASIDYLEAHGTGTSLGDPIEITGLTRAFAHAQGPIAIGSVKSNIGHCESAAGIAGLTKILLQLRHDQLVASLHADTINPHIDFDDTPFVLQRKLTPWPANNQPRRAGLSSFGAGGSNAHLILQEAPTSPPPNPRQGPALIVLSAKDEPRLRETVQRLADFLVTQSPDLHDLAYTLQVGREPMAQRLAFEARTLADLRERLAAYLTGPTGDWYRGQARRAQDAAFMADEQLDEVVRAWARQGKRDRLLEFWVEGFVVDWEHLHEGAKPRRISLPTYPFARERHWVDRSPVRAAGGATGFLHPLVHRNTSDFEEQRYTTTFTGTEFFLADHRVHGQRVLPAAASLEMARAAVELALGHDAFHLSDVVWARPVVVDGAAVDVHVGLSIDDEGDRIAVEIYGEAEDGEPVVHLHGEALIEAWAGDAASGREPARIDLEAARAACAAGGVAVDDCYAELARRGIAGGPRMRGLTQVWAADGQVVARVAVPQEVRGGERAFGVHPSLLDAALQAGIALDAGAGTASAVPFTVSRATVHGPRPDDVWVWLRARDDSHVLDVDLCDGEGRVWVGLSGLAVREVQAPAVGTLVLEPSWSEPVARSSAAFGRDPTQLPAARPGSRVVLASGAIPAVEDLLGDVRCARLSDFEPSAVQVLHELRHALDQAPPSPSLFQLVVTADPDDRLLGGLAGMLDSAAHEDARVRGQLVEVPVGSDAASVVAWLDQAAGQPSTWLRASDEGLLAAGWQEVSSRATVAPWQEGGVYLITGGRGGLGQLLVDEIRRRVSSATVVLVGRSGGEATEGKSRPSAAAEHRQDEAAAGVPEHRRDDAPADEPTEHAQDEAPAGVPEHRQDDGPAEHRQDDAPTGVRVEHRQADVCDREAVARLVADVVAAHGRLDGVVHAAGVLRDGLVVTKTAEDVAAVLAPKVAGARHLDEATADLPLEFFVLYGSLAGVSGNVGQADYAAANAFLDRFAERRAELVSAGRRSGRTVSVSWPLWAGGGMKLDPDAVRMLGETAGLVPLPAGAGMQALYRAIGSGSARVAVLHGDVARLSAAMMTPSRAASAEAVRALPAGGSGVDVPLAQDAYAGEAAVAQDASCGEASVAQDAPGTEASVAQDASGGEASVAQDASRGEASVAQDAPGTEASVAQVAGDLSRRVARYVAVSLASVIKLPADRIGLDEPLDSYGVDSIAAVELIRRLEASFGPLARTLVFEYRTINVLADYFVQAHPDRLATVLPATSHARRAEPAAAEAALAPRRGPAAAEAALAPRRAARRRGSRRERRATADVAIVGLAGRYPQADSLAEFWENLRSGRDCITEIPAERWDPAAHAISAGWGGFLSGVDRFDPLFFNISPADAELMDPQERLFLECAYATLQDAGYTRAQAAAAGQVGVFVGVMYEEYQLHGAQEQARGRSVAVGGIPSSIANRVSYFCDFHGPSLALDTMCSSSLTAIHLACQSIQRGESQLALAGGVNVSVHPNKYLMLEQGGFLSASGRCESFGAGGDGYIPGEGVGAVLLKALDQAVADGDHIHAVIKASAVNHGGRTNGYTVPNPAAQADVIARALRDAQIAPASIDYLEAHGTGTSLGDPIEITGLTRAFADAQGPIAIGSVKSNIGHCESAAGIAGLTKILLQLRHHELVASLHADTLNPHIDFDDTPFVLQRQLTPWPANNQPRRAGLSSFGAGGSNAHLILQEAPTSPPPNPRQGHALIVLSAKDEPRLRETVQRLRDYLDSEPSVDLHDLAYTLQVGREAMDERLAFQTHALADLRERLAAYLADHTGDWYRQRARRTQDGAFAADDDLDDIVRTWARRGKHDRLLELWVEGFAVDWEHLYPDSKPRRISLPTYPFAKERHWLALTAPDAHGVAAAAHPLVHHNASTLWQQRFETTLTGREFFLADHRVNGQRVLPAAAELELAYVALGRTLAPPDDTQVRVARLVWQRPLALADGAGPMTVAITIEPQPDDTVALNVRDAGQDEDGLAYLRCSAYLCAAESPRPLDLAVLRARCTRSLRAEQSYAELQAAGIVHGPRMRALQEIRAGEHEALARVALPANAADDRFVLHPSLLDAAVQAAVGLAMQADREPAPSLPFALEELAVHAPLPQQAWVWIRRRETAPPADQVLDIDVADDSGRVCAQLHGLSLRATASASTVLLTPSWSAAPEAPAAQVGATTVVYASERVAGLAELLEDGRLLAPDDFEAGASSVVSHLQQLLADPSTGDVLVELVVTDDPADRLLGGLLGVLLTAQREDPRIRGHLLEVPAGADPRAVLGWLDEISGLPSGSRVRGDKDGLQVAGWDEPAPGEPEMPWRDGGVYLVTGGRGGLGRLLLDEIALRAPSATVVLAGRSTPDDEPSTDEAAGVRVDHRQVDVTDREAVAALVAAIVADHGRLDGVVHCAGVLRDSLLAHKTAPEVATVLAPKVAGARNLDAATRELELDFFVLFSSIAGVTGNPGQADYAAGSAFLDRFAEYRDALVARGERSGRTLAVDWPLWAEGGMGVDPALLPAITRASGIVPMPAADGMRALYQALAAGCARVMVLHGDPARLRAGALAADAPRPAPSVSGHAAALRRLRGVLTSTAARILRVDPAELDPDTDLADYGFEPVTLARFAERLNETYRLDVAPSLFHEHATLGGLSGYLGEAHPELIATIPATAEDRDYAHP